MREGIDYTGGLGPADVRRLGASFACRYLSTPGNPKNITPAELRALHTAGLGVVLVFETWGFSGGHDRNLLNVGGGRLHGESAAQQLRALGAPDHQPVYFALDEDPALLPRQGVLDYVAGLRDVLGATSVGLYGGFDALRLVAAQGSAVWLWQTYAWSGGRLLPGHLYQYANGPRFDRDRALRPRFGSWEPASPAPAPALTPVQLRFLWARWRLGEGEFHSSGAANPAVRPSELPARVPRWWWLWLAAFLRARR